MRCKVALAVAVLFGLVAVVRAEPLDLKQVSAEAKWAAHLDIDALHASGLFQKARAQMLKEHPEAEKHLAMCREMWNFDPCKDLHGITIYGRQLKKDTGVAIVRAKVDRKKLVEKAKAAPDHRLSTYGKYELHSWIHAKGSKHERSMAGAFYTSEVIVFGGSAEEVMAALDVLDGTKPNFAAKAPKLCGAIPKGAILVGGVAGLGDANLPCKCPLAKQVDLLMFDIGEYQGQVFVDGTVMAKTATVAQQMKTVAEGALALAALMHNNDADTVKLIGAAQVTVADKAVSLKWSASVDAAWAQLQKCIAKAKAMHKDWGHHGPDGCPMGKPGGCPLQKK